jgi:hypothetical protein
VTHLKFLLGVDFSVGRLNFIMHVCFANSYDISIGLFCVLAIVGVCCGIIRSFGDVGHVQTKPQGN